MCSDWGSPLPAAYRGRLTPADEARARRLLPAKLDQLEALFRSVEACPEGGETQDQERIRRNLAQCMVNQLAVLRPLAERLGMAVPGGACSVEGGDDRPATPPPGVAADASFVARVYLFSGEGRRR